MLFERGMSDNVIEYFSFAYFILRHWINLSLPLPRCLFHPTPYKIASILASLAVISFLYLTVSQLVKWHKQWVFLSPCISIRWKFGSVLYILCEQTHISKDTVFWDVTPCSLAPCALFLTSESRLFTVGWQDYWWMRIGKDLEGSGRGLI
jgi:hypothetical protein